MTPAEREEELVRRETLASLLASKLEKDRLALEAEITASAAASKAAGAITRALQSDALKKVKALEAEVAVWEAKLGRVKSDAAKAPVLAAAPAAPAAPSPPEAELTAAREAMAAERAKLEEERASFDTEVADARARLKAEARTLAEMRTKLASIRTDIEASVKAREADVKRREAQLETDRDRLQAAADSLMRAESQQAAERTKLEAQMAAQATKEVMFDERNRQLQERMKNFAKA